MPESATYKRPESVLVLLYTQQGDVLLLQRTDVPAFWQSVTGALETGESPADAAKRELLEETGIDVTCIDATIKDHHCSHVFEISGAWRKRYHPDQLHNREHVFSLALNDQMPIVLDKSEHRACHWLTANEALERVSSHTNKQAIESIVCGAAQRYSE